MDLSDDELSDIADQLGVSPTELQSEAVKDCAESVLRDNPEMEKSRAFAICQDMENEGQLAQITLAEVQDPGRIERVEEDGEVRYANLKLLGTGIWGDSGTQQHFLYSERTIEHLADNVVGDTLNLFHERENEVTDIGRLDAESVFVGESDGGLYGDIVLHMDNAASEFADEALQNALETGGREGLQGPSLEIQGDEYEFNADHGVHELVEGRIIGIALVGLGVSPGPGSEDAAFAEQTRKRAVALSEADDAVLLTNQNHVTMDINELRERLADVEAVQLSDDADEDELRALAAAFDIDLQEDEEDEDEPDDEQPDDDEEMDGDEDDDGEDEVNIDLTDVAERVDQIADQVATNAERIEALAEQSEQLSEQTVEVRESEVSLSELAEQRADLAEAVEDIDSRLSALEDEPEEPTSLASMGGADQPDGAGKYLVEMGPNAPQKPAFNQH